MTHAIDWPTFTVSRMRWSFFVGADCGHFGDVVVWIGPLYISWDWRPAT